MRAVLIQRGLAATLLSLVALSVPFGPLAAQSPAVDLPSGTQFTEAPLEPPDRPGVDWVALAAADDTTLLAGSDRRQGLGRVLAARMLPDAGWDETVVDDGRGFRGPGGRLSLGTRLSVTALAAGEAGYAAAGSATWNTPAGTIPSPVSTALLWTSEDGGAWTRFDPRSVLGRRSSVGVTALSEAPGGGFVAAATVGPQANDRPTRVVVLASRADGTWTQLAELASRWSLRADRLLSLADGRLVLLGRELACIDADRDLAYVIGDVGSQLRAWVSDDGGTSWEPVDLEASGVISAQRPAPRSTRECPEDYTTLNERYSSEGSIVGAVGDALVALSEDGSRAAVSTDLERWTAADLPGATPEGSFGRSMTATAAVAAPEGGIAMLTLEDRRDDRNQARDAGRQVLGWRSDDLGATWERLPDPRPMLLAEDEGTGVSAPAWQDQLQPAADGSTWLLERSDGRIVRAWRSAEEPLVAWTPCVPERGGACPFALVDDLDLRGADLVGVDLTAATIRGGDWSGVDLTNAVLSDAIVGAPLTGARLDGAVAHRTLFFEDLTDVSIEGSELDGARVPLSLLAALPPGRLRDMTFAVPVVASGTVDLAGKDLRAVSFTSADTPDLGDMRDTDLRGADLSGARFSHVDLTGADLRRARVADVSFFEVLCPDGEAPTEGVFGHEACRLRP